VEIKGYVSNEALEKIRQCPKEVRLIAKEEIQFFIDYAKEKYKVLAIETLYDNARLV